MPWWRIIEHVWLDVVAPPMSDRLASAGFAPDPSWAYCPRCGLSVGLHDATLAEGCSTCREDSPSALAEHVKLCHRGGWDRLVRLGEYRHPLRHMIHDVKFTAWRRLGTDLGTLLGHSIKAAMDDAREDGLDLTANGKPIVVPVPASTWRRMSRGIDHAAVIARGVCQTLDAEFAPMLHRRHRPPQTSLAATARRRNVAGAIRPRRSLSSLTRAADVQPGRLIIVVDDIMTTGATLKAACQVVRQVLDAGSTSDDGCTGKKHVWGAVLARTPLAKGAYEDRT